MGSLGARTRIRKESAKGLQLDFRRTLELGAQLPPRQNLQKGFSSPGRRSKKMKLGNWLSGSCFGFLCCVSFFWRRACSGWIRLCTQCSASRTISLAASLVVEGCMGCRSILAYSRTCRECRQTCHQQNPRNKEGGKRQRTFACPAFTNGLAIETAKSKKCSEEVYKFAPWQHAKIRKRHAKRPAR